ncbi:branched-chain amino acid ABC transporter permease [Variovorax sp. PBL-E5]|uniref:branched-chain amino acid ABC transporter permease n=1 Tax=Variovorax sp. PBL-E5 TaxID=434014 RepID=UPI001315B89D|nr:branched-chain amino acid ABC transporter permease [Variovorax sp. PBL-E5]VTU23087.1 LIV-I protein H [Variovorax sp. PBL-E5]
MLITLFQQLVNGLMSGTLYALMAVGLTMTFGIMNITNFAHGEFLMIGAFATFALVQAGMPFVPAVLVGALAAALLGVIVERLTFRYTLDEPINGLVVSLGLIAILQNGMARVVGTESYNLAPPFAGTVQIAGVVLAVQRVWTIGLGALVIFAVWLLLKKSSLGRSLRALAVDRTAASLMGVRTERMYSIAFGLGCGLAGAAGGLLAALFPVSPFMGAAPVAKGFIVIVLGGLGSVPGAIAGGLLLGVVEALGAGYISSAFRDGFGFVILILVLLIRPKGLFGVLERRA